MVSVLSRYTKDERPRPTPTTDQREIRSRSVLAEASKHEALRPSLSPLPRRRQGTVIRRVEDGQGARVGTSRLAHARRKSLHRRYCASIPPPGTLQFFSRPHRARSPLTNMLQREPKGLL